MIHRIYPVNVSDTQAPLLGFNLLVSNGIVSTKIYDKRDDFDFTGASCHVNDFHSRNKFLIAKLQKHDYRYRKAFL